MISPPLKGLVAQRMAPRATALAPYAASFPVGSHTFTAPDPGFYKFVLWGAGSTAGATAAGDTTGGSSGAYVEYTRLLQVGETVVLSVGAGASGRGISGTATTATFSDGRVVTAGGGIGTGVGGGAGGTASNGDVNINGSAGSTGASNAGGGTNGGAGGSGTAGGAGAPANSPFKGATGGAASATVPVGPGAGAGLSTNGGSPGAGNAIVLRVDGPYRP